MSYNATLNHFDMVVQVTFWANNTFSTGEPGARPRFYRFRRKKKGLRILSRNFVLVLHQVEEIEMVIWWEHKKIFDGLYLKTIHSIPHFLGISM